MTDNAYATHKIPSSGNSGDLLKPEDGKSYKLRIVGEAVVYSSEFDGKLSTSYAMTVWNFTDNKACIFRLPAGSFQQIVDLANSDWGDPTSYNLAYKRTGSMLETRHSLQVSPNKDELTEDQVEQVKAINLKEVLERFPSVSQVFYLAEADNQPTDEEPLPEFKEDF